MSRSSKLRIANMFRRFVEVLPALVLAAPLGPRARRAPVARAWSPLPWLATPRRELSTMSIRSRPASRDRGAPRQPRQGWTYPTRLGGVRVDPRGHGRGRSIRARTGTPEGHASSVRRRDPVPVPTQPRPRRRRGV